MTAVKTEKDDAEFSKDMLVKLGVRIQTLRKQKGYDSYEHFAYDKQISRSQFGRYEKGKDLRFSSLIRIVKAMDMTLVEFFGEGFD